MKNRIYLCKPKGTLIAPLEVDEETVSLAQHAATLWELTFSIHRYIIDDKIRENPYYNSVSEFMELYLVSEHCCAEFLIDVEPAVNSDGITEVKTVTAHSLEAELQHRFLEDFQVNTGNEISQENLLNGNLLGEPVAAVNNSEDVYMYNLNPYTNLPIDYITISCQLGEELQNFLTNLSSTQIVWKFDGEENETVIPITFSTSTGVISSTDSEKLKKWYQEFVFRYPRVITDLTWGYDKQDANAATYNSIICVVDSYIAMNQNNQIYVPSPTHRYALNQEGTAYNIYKASSSPTYNFENFKNGIHKVIQFYEKFSNQLSLLDLVLEKAKATDWSVGNVPENIAVKKCTFNTDYQDIYSFLTNDFARSFKVIVVFDTLRKKLNVIDLSLNDEDFETGIVTGFQNLLNSVDIATSSSDGIKTTFKPYGANDLGIELVNFGSNKITNLDYFINKVDADGEYQYGSAELHEKYRQWNDYRDKTLFSKSVPTYTFNLNKKTISQSTTTLQNLTNRQLYKELSIRYNQTLKDVSELTYLVPSDGAMTDYTSYPLDELKTAMTAYLNAYNALIELYKAEFGKTEVVDSEIIETYFYHDYVLYRDTIIPNVRNALKIYALTDKNGNFLDKNGNQTSNYDDFVYPDGGNPEYNGNAEMVTESKHDEYLYDMTLYGLSELNVKKKAWADTAAQIYKPAFVKSGTPGVNATYRSWSQIVAENLSTGFTDKQTYERQLNKYLDYMSTTTRNNELTKSSSKGVIVLATEEIKKCENVLSKIKSVQEQLGNMRSELAYSVTYEGWGKFTDEELSILYTLSHEAEYRNDNILTTNLDDVVSQIDVQQELYDDASKKLFDKSRPQYTISTTIQNILAVDGFEPLQDQLELLNYFYVKYGLYDDETFKLRIVGMTYNPLIKTEDFAIEFSNMTYTLEGLDDFYYLFEDGGGGSSSGGGSSGGGSSGGTYGTNDAEINLSNNMLNALLRNSSTPSSINITNLLNTKQIENLLVRGDMVINGAAVTNELKSKNYNGTEVGGIDNTAGSIINLSNGNFNFGGGKLTFNGSELVLSGGTFKSSTVESGIIKSSIIESGIIKSSNYNGSNDDINNTKGSIFNLNTGKMNLGGGSLTYDNSKLILKGELVSGAVKSSNYNGTNNGINNTKGSIIELTNGYFNFAGGGLKYDGTEVSLEGKITSSSGNIGGWTIAKNALQTEGIIINSNGQISIDASKIPGYSDFILAREGNYSTVISAGYLRVANTAMESGRANAIWLQSDAIWLYNTDGTKARILSYERGLYTAHKDPSDGKWYVD